MGKPNGICHIYYENQDAYDSGNPYGEGTDSERHSAEEAASATQDTTQAGANVVLADGSVNCVTGSHVARIYMDNGNQKNLHKYDAAFYSRMSMNMNGQTAGTGVLNIIADNEGLDSELHLTINGGKIAGTSLEAEIPAEKWTALPRSCFT